MDRLFVTRAGCALAVLIALTVAMIAAYCHREAQAAAVAQRAEVERIRNALLRAAEAAERASIATTPLDTRQARKTAALREFEAAEAEMLMQQTLAKQVHEARRGGAASAGNPTTGRSSPGP